MRSLREVTVVPGQAGVSAVATALRAAEDGGPAVLPIAAGASGALVRRALAAVTLVPDDVIAVIATSGSTGAPRGVALTRANLLSAVSAVHHRLGGPGAWIVAIPANGVAGFMCVARSTIGGMHVIADPDVGGAGSFPSNFAATVRRARADADADAARLYVSLVPTQLRRVLALDPAVLLACDAVVIGGSAPFIEDIDTARAAGINIVVSYGMTETTGGAVYDRKPLAGIAVSTEAADGRSVGRLVITGPSVASGYVPVLRTTCASRRCGRQTSVR